MKKSLLTAMFLLQTAMFANEQVIIEVDGANIAKNIEMQNEKILEKYIEQNSNVQIESLPPFATMADVKVAVSKLIDNSNKLNTDLSNMVATNSSKESAIADLDQQLIEAKKEIEMLKYILTTSDLNTTEGKMTFSGAEKRIVDLENKSKQIVVKKQKIKKIYAKSIFIPNAKIRVETSVNLRTAPYNCATIISALMNDEKIQVLPNKNKQWDRVKTSKGTIGWVNSSFISK